MHVDASSSANVNRCSLIYIIIAVRFEKSRDLRKMRIFRSCPMIAETAENLGDRPSRYFGLMETALQAQAIA